MSEDVGKDLAEMQQNPKLAEWCEMISRAPKLISDAAGLAHEVNRAYCNFLGDNSQAPWNEAPQWQRDSYINGVRAVVSNPQITPTQQHSLWMAEKKHDGWVYGEEKDPEKKTHPCLMPYDELPDDQRLKDTLFVAVVRAMLGIPQ